MPKTRPDRRVFFDWLRPPPPQDTALTIYHFSIFVYHTSVTSTAPTPNFLTLLLLSSAIFVRSSFSSRNQKRNLFLYPITKFLHHIFPRITTGSALALALLSAEEAAESESIKISDSDSESSLDEEGDGSRCSRWSGSAVRLRRRCWRWSILCHISSGFCIASLADPVPDSSSISLLLASSCKICKPALVRFLQYAFWENADASRAASSSASPR